MGYNIELEGQVAVVTGAAQGIGAAIAKSKKACRSRGTGSDQ